MNSKSTWIWLGLAAGLFAFIYFVQDPERGVPPPPPAILSEEWLQSPASVVVRPANQPEIRAERTNGTWQLIRPLAYPAQPVAIEGLLAALAALRPAAYLSASELRDRPNASAEYGFTEPQFSVTVQRADARRQLLFGTRTAPGDQVFLQVVGNEGVFVVTADILKLIPRSPDQWRDRALVDLANVVLDRITLTNAGTVIELQADPVLRSWRMTRPLPARADGARINALLVELHGLRVTQFVTDDPATDREQFGLRPPEFSLGLSRGTNSVLQLHFGKSPTNQPAEIYALRADQPATVVLVNRERVTPWRAAPNDLRDRQLVAVGPGTAQIDFATDTKFSLARTTNGGWRAVGEKFPLDAPLVNEVLAVINAMKILEFRDVVTEPDLPTFGLDAPLQSLTLRTTPAEGPAPTNGSALVVTFGRTQDQKTFARRSDENPVYAVAESDVLQLPLAAWQLRERRLWNFTPAEVARVTLRQGGQTRQLVREGTNSWAIAAGSQGMIDGQGVELAVEEFGQLAATFWVARSPQDATAFGLGPESRGLDFDVKSGAKFTVEFGSRAPTGYPYAGVMLDGEWWVFESPLAAYQLAQAYLNLTPAKP